ncbi:hypothetical protein LIER_23826 [Lithospermum erythrorhizon]|uniref:Uncharacterized protein n=1 Tax=Lithospermum erythrorhizon TaxID=34254 RepID=A0AAV3R309_LITER
MSMNIGDVGSGVNNPEEGSVNVSSFDDPEEGSVNIGDAEGDEGRPTVIDTDNDTEKDENVTLSVRDTAMEDVEVMTSMDVPRADRTSNVTKGREDVIPNVVDTGAGVGNLPKEKKRAEPTVGESATDTLNTEGVEILEAASQEKKKSKKRKHKRNANEGEASEPKKKLSKEERAAKKAKRTERKARKATEEATGDDVQEIANEQVAVDVRPTGSDSWNPTVEQS